MMPMFLTVSVRADGRKPTRIWLPLILLWIPLAPLLVLVVPAVMVLGVLCRANPFAAVGRLFGVLFALAGTLVEVEAPDASVFVHIT